MRQGKDNVYVSAWAKHGASSRECEVCGHAGRHATGSNHLCVAGGYNDVHSESRRLCCRGSKCTVLLQALELHDVEKDVAAFIKRDFDGKFEPTWHCVVGKSFGAILHSEQSSCGREKLF